MIPFDEFSAALDRYKARKAAAPTADAGAATSGPAKQNSGKATSGKPNSGKPKAQAAQPDDLIDL